MLSISLSVKNGQRVVLDEQGSLVAQGLSNLYLHQSRVALCLTPVNAFDEMFRQCESLGTTLVENVA